MKKLSAVASAKQRSFLKSYPTVLAFGLSVVLLSSCTKEASVSAPEKTFNPKALMSATMPTDVSLLAVDGGWCIPPAINCAVMKEVVITAEQISYIDGAITSGPAAIGALFSTTEYADLVAEIGAAALGDLQSGNYTLAVNYEDETSINYIVGDPGAATALAYASMDYVISFDKEEVE